MFTNDGYVCLFRNNFFSDIVFFFKFYSAERRTKMLKLCENLVKLSAEKPFGGLCARSCAR